MPPLAVADLFSGCGGMSRGFARQESFRIVAAADAERGKPGGAPLRCNRVYARNIGVEPTSMDLARAEAGEIAALVGGADVLLACTPCTDFSRARPGDRLEDRPRNSLVGRVGDVVALARPAVLVMENAREMLSGRHRHHLEALRARLEGLGYAVSARAHVLSRFGLPQARERTLVVASRVGPPRGPDELWEGWEVPAASVTVRAALSRLPALRDGLGPDPDDAFPRGRPGLVARLAATPADGGSWRDLARDPATVGMLTPGQRLRHEAGEYGSHPDAYGRMWWDRPAPTIKRESAHVGNGRYAHPEEDRLMTVREMATLQGFPADYDLSPVAVTNRYRLVGDAVPPLVSRQVAAAVAWTVTGRRPDPSEWMLERATLGLGDLRRA